MRKWLLLLLAVCAASGHAVQVTDDNGRRVDFERPPQRIVSLLPSLTEFVCALDACARLVGVLAVERQVGQRLEQGQRAELQRIELERVRFHGAQHAIPAASTQ